MFPFLFGVFGLAPFLDELFKQKQTNNIMPFTGVISSSFYDAHKWIEGYRETAYRDSRGIVTVGIGLTVFPYSKGKPQFGVKYSADFLKREYDTYLANAIKKEKAFLDSWRVPYDQNLFEVILDMSFQGFSDYRRQEAKKYWYKGREAFADWLLTPDGMWAQFWNPKNPSAYASRWGVLKRAIWRAYWVMGENKSEAFCASLMNDIRYGKKKKPVFSKISDLVL